MLVRNLKLDKLELECFFFLTWLICKLIWSWSSGISGLYRGISSNIVSSAPISALYTFTYESVKKSLLPLLPKVIQSFVTE